MSVVVLKYIFSLLLAIIIIIKIEGCFSNEVFGSSPSFVRQEINDSPHDLIDKNTNIKASEVDFNTYYLEKIVDIRKISYFSDGSFLNATLWLNGIIDNVDDKEEELKKDRLAYGIYIDVDPNSKTGFNGNDYQVVIEWKNKTWTRTLAELSSTGDKRILDERTIDPNPFKKEMNHIPLYVDLGSIGFPNHYRIIFYTERDYFSLERNISLHKADFSEELEPPVDFIISTIPSSMTIRPGDNKTVNVQVKSTTGFESLIHLYTTNQPSYIEMNFPDKVRISAFQTLSMPVNIKVSGNDDDHPYDTSIPIPILVNLTYPSIAANENTVSFIETNSSISQDKNNDRYMESDVIPLEPPSFVKIEKMIGQSNEDLTLRIEPPLNQIDEALNSLNKWQFLISFTSGIMTGHVVPWLFNKVRKKRKG